MSDELVFYTNPMSRGRIVRWMLEEVEQPYRTVTLDYGTTMKAPEYLAINPMGKVPAITHRGVVVTEAAAICAYLADAFPGAGLAPPPGDPLRGPYYRWLFFAAGPVEQAVTARSMNLLAPPELRGRVGYGTYEETIDALESALRPGPYILGERFSAADVYVGSSLGWGLMSKGIEPRPLFQEYVGRLFARPAARRANEIDGAMAR
jgi:glutathione S-transferase